MRFKKSLERVLPVLFTVAVIGAPRLSQAAGLARTIEISVTAKGFEPARIQVAKGEALTLVVTRRTDDTCVRRIVIPDEKIDADLPLGKPVTVRFTPQRTGEITYACQMNMITGTIVVTATDSTGNPPGGTTPGGSANDGSDRMQGMNGTPGRTSEGGHRGRCGCMHGHDGASSGT